MSENRVEKIFDLADATPEFIAKQKQNGKDLAKNVIDRSEYFVLITGTKKDGENRFEIKMSCAPEHVPYIIKGMTIALNALLETQKKVQKNIDPT